MPHTQHSHSSCAPEISLSSSKRIVRANNTNPSTRRPPASMSPSRTLKCGLISSWNIYLLSVIAVVFLDKDVVYRRPEWNSSTKKGWSLILRDWEDGVTIIRDVYVDEHIFFAAPDDTATSLILLLSFDTSEWRWDEAFGSYPNNVDRRLLIPDGYDLTCSISVSCWLQGSQFLTHTLWHLSSYSPLCSTALVISSSPLL